MDSAPAVSPRRPSAPGHQGLAARLAYAAAVVALGLAGCAAVAPAQVTVLDGERVLPLASGARTAGEALQAAGISLAAEDRLLLDGAPAQKDQSLPANGRSTLQVRRALPVTLVTPDGTQVLLTAARDVGAAVEQAGYPLHAADHLDPPAGTPLAPGMVVTYRPARPLTIQVAGGSLQARSAARSVGEALAQAGLALQGLDYSQPAPGEPLPADGLVRLVRVREELRLAQESIPFTSEFVASAEVELDQQQILQPGIAGLSVARTRVRYEDGQEVSRASEGGAVVRPPQNRVVGYGTKVAVRTTTVGGVQIEYWRALNLFATSYSPCRSAADRCYHGTSSGKPVVKGVVAVKYSWYLLMQGQPVYVPGYGYATIEDVGGGIPGTPWIDLGYSDNDWVQWGDWVTVYFLTPVPANVPYLLD